MHNANYGPALYGFALFFDFEPCSYICRYIYTYNIGFLSLGQE